MWIWWIVRSFFQNSEKLVLILIKYIEFNQIFLILCYIKLIWWKKWKCYIKWTFYKPRDSCLGKFETFLCHLVLIVFPPSFVLCHRMCERTEASFFAGVSWWKRVAYFSPDVFFFSPEGYFFVYCIFKTLLFFKSIVWIFRCRRRKLFRLVGSSKI